MIAVVVVVIAVAAVPLVGWISPRLAESPVVAAEPTAINPPGPDFSLPRYFQGRPGDSTGLLNADEVSVQIKRIASTRGVAVTTVRQLVNTQEQDRRQEGSRTQKIDIQTLNQALDAHWPAR
jgi:K+-transporting ATPase c subunit